MIFFNGVKRFAASRMFDIALIGEIAVLILKVFIIYAAWKVTRIKVMSW